MSYKTKLARNQAARRRYWKNRIRKLGFHRSTFSRAHPTYGER